MSLLQLVTGLARRILVSDKSPRAGSQQQQTPSQPQPAEPRAGSQQQQTPSQPQPAEPRARAEAATSSASPQAATPPAERLQPSDEATIRHRAEADLGGMSSEESRRAWERGENPGGLHHKGHGPTAAHRGTHDPAPVLEPAESGETS